MNSHCKMDQARLTRRDFIVSGAVVGSGLMLSIPLFCPGGASHRHLRPHRRGLLGFSADCGRMTRSRSSRGRRDGTGRTHAMPMILMDELGGGWAHLQVKDARQR